MTETRTLEPATGTWVVRVGGAVLGETTRALQVTDADGASVIYFPKDDIGMAFLEPMPASDTASDIQYFSIMSKSKTYTQAAWLLDAQAIGADIDQDYLAFDVQDGVAVEQV